MEIEQKTLLFVESYGNIGSRKGELHMCIKGKTNSLCHCANYTISMVNQTSLLPANFISFYDKCSIMSG